MAKPKLKYVVQAKTVTIHSATVEASSMKEACLAFLAGNADVFDTLNLETKFVSVLPEQ